MKHILLIASLFLMFSCSKGDESNEPQTFLEKYDGTGWISADDSYSSYIYFFDETEFAVSYDSDDDYCFSLSEGTNQIEGVTAEIVIVENTPDILIVEIEYIYSGESIFTSSTQFSVNSSGTVLTLSSNDGYENQTDTYQSTEVSLSSLCN
jgi:hypothetical protein